MRDFNFFEPYLKVQAKPKRSKVLLIILGALVLALIIYYQVFLILQTSKLNSDIAEVDEYLNAPETLRHLDLINIKQTKETQLSLANDDLNLLIAQLKNEDIIDEMFIDLINAQIPQGLFVSEMNLSQESLTAKGYSEDYDAIAQFAYNLRESGRFSDVQIPSVVEDNANYVYLINATLSKEVTNEN